ncbi:MAG TPA: DUF3459 domain-containing protein, partial [Sphingomonas sp.]|nr:DUF3459 domain-containing protein [Sphingomonas sp.]
IAFNRDEVRMPMPWDASPQAGFTTGEPWLPLNRDWRTRNVATQAADPASMLALHRDLLGLRRRHAALAIGSIALLAVEGDVLAYERVHDGERIVVALNFGATDQHVTLPEGELLLSCLDPDAPEAGAGGEMTLAPDEAVILRVAAA